MEFKTLPTERAIVTKAADDVLTFVISHEAPDLENDVVVQSGIKTSSDRLPGIVDHSHKMGDSIGVWENLASNGESTTADLRLLPKGVTKGADLVRAMADAGVRLGASIGFTPLQSEARKPAGRKFNSILLHEVSVVVVPAQPLALQVAKSLGMTQEDIESVIGQALTESQQRLLNRAADAVKAVEAMSHENHRGTNPGSPGRTG